MSNPQITYGRVLGTVMILAAGALLWHHGLEDAHVKYIFMAGGVGVLLAAAKELASGIMVVGAAVRNSPAASYLPKRLSGQVKPPSDGGGNAAS